MSSTFVGVLVGVVLAVGGLVALSVPLCIGRRRLVTAARELRPRLLEAAPYALILGAVLVVNKGTQALVVELSWALNYNLTGVIYGIEGEFVPAFQAVLPPWLMVYFSALYVVGYSFMLVFPPLAYLCLPSVRRLKELLVAYGLNYAVGVACYALFVAYGPRNVMPDIVDQPLFELYPEVFLLTSAVNTNTNVFPSLHTSLSVTVIVFAWYTREEYPRWTPIATVVGASVVLATMALGIHWLIDVLAGIVLGVVAAVLAGPAVDRLDTWSERRREGLAARLT